MILPGWQCVRCSRNWSLSENSRGHFNGWQSCLQWWKASMRRQRWEVTWVVTTGHWKDEKWWERWVVTKMFEMVKSFTVKKDEKSPQWWQNCLQWEQMRSHISGDKFVFNEKSPQWWRGTSSHHGAHRSQGSRWGEVFFTTNLTFILIFVWWSLICPFCETGLPTCNFCTQSNFGLFSQWISRKGSRK